ncbi:hypothetical protein PanWU01x14_282880 [Parasponia andersonii]|uniref:Uncharacterized protein n=1 Tax=Parasponia andersonii TaxID=3476 RepID=A0A2P5B0M2_PARAD|nr:hypothetical protein PanWU01x14_282880 [Parasponia andersonii]
MALILSAASDSDVAAAAAKHTVFVDTSLDTHLAMVVSHLDTVSDLKKKIEKEHALCFTNIGQIVVHALKVKRKSRLYHLPDCMTVNDAFDWAKKNWFLSVDASRVEKSDEKQLAHNPDSDNLFTCFGIISNTSADGVDLPFNGTHEQGPSDPNKKGEVPQLHVECNCDASKHAILEWHNMFVEEASQSDQVAKGKRKVEHLQEKNIGSGKGTSGPEIVSQKLYLSTKGDVSKGDILEQCNAFVEEASQSDQVANRKGKTVHVQEENIDSVKETSKPESVSRHHSATSKPDILEQSNMLVEEASQSDQVANRKSKTEHVQQENIDFVKETSKPESVSQHHSATSKPDILEQSNMLVEDASQSDRVAKRKRKTKHLQEESTAIVKLASDPKIISQHQSASSKGDIPEESNMLVEEASQSEQVAKRKHKTECLQEENTDSVKEISKPEVLSQHHLGDKKKIENDTLDGSTAKPVDDGHLMKNSSGRRKWKKGKKSGDKLNEVVAGLPSAEKNVLREHYKVTTKVDHKDSDGEPDTASVPVHGEHGITPLEICRTFMKEKCSDIIQEAGKYAPTAIDVGNKSNATVKEATCAADKMRNSENLYPVNVESNCPLAMEEPNDQQMDDRVSGGKNSGTVQAERAAEQRALSKKDRMQANEPDPCTQDTTKVKIQSVNVTADLLGESVKIVPSKSSKTRKVRKTKDSVGKTLVTSGREDTEGPKSNIIGQPLEANYSQQPGNNVRKEESSLSQRNGNKGLELSTENTFLAKENDDLSGNEGKNMQQTRKDQGKAENVEKQVRKEPKRKRKLSEKNLLDMQLEDRNIVEQSSMQRSDNKSEVVTLSSAKKKGRLETPALIDQSKEEKLESKNFGAETDVVPTQPNSEFANSTKVQSHALDHIHKARPVKANLTDYAPESGNADEANNQIETSELGKKRNLEKHLPAAVASSGVDKMTKTKRAAIILQSKKTTKNDAHSNGTSSDLQSSLKSNDKQGIEIEVVSSSSTKKKGRSEKPALKDQSKEERLESKNLGADTDVVPTQPNSEYAKSTKVQSHKLDHSHKVRPVKANLTDYPPETGNADEANNQIEASELGNKNNLEKHLPEVVASSGVDKMTKAKRAAIILQSKMTTKNDARLNRTSSDLPSSLKSNDKQGLEAKFPAKNSTVPLQVSLSKDKSNDSTVHPEKKQLKDSRKGAKASLSNTSDQLDSTPEGTRKPNVANAAGTKVHSKKNTASVSVSHSSLQRSMIMTSQNMRSDKQRSGVDNNHASGGKVSNKNNGEIVNSAEHQKKLLATPGSIFEVGDASSEDEEVDDASDASNKNQSDYSSVYSDGESNANPNLPRTGSDTSDETESEGRNIMKSSISRAKDMDFGTVLRSSSRYHKAKLTASQLQMEDESQQVDFVPDSQAN